jgi:hypothetical protein
MKREQTTENDFAVWHGLVTKVEDYGDLSMLVRGSSTRLMHWINVHFEIRNSRPPAVASCALKFFFTFNDAVLMVLKPQPKQMVEEMYLETEIHC